MPKCVVSRKSKIDCKKKTNVSKCLDKHRERCDDVTATLADEEHPLQITHDTCKTESRGVCTVNVKQACGAWGCYYSPPTERKPKPEPTFILDPKTGAPILYASRTKRDRARHPADFKRQCKALAKGLELPADDVTVRCFDWIYIG